MLPPPSFRLILSSAAGRPTPSGAPATFPARSTVPAQAAQALGIGRRDGTKTVATHVGNIFATLQLRNRTEAAAYAQRYLAEDITAT